MSPLAALAVAIGGALGAAARFALTVAIASPWSSARATFVVNASGSLLAGVLAAVSLRLGLPAELELAVGGGFLGAYTTFSTWTVQIVEAYQRGERRAAALDLFASPIACALAAAAGLGVGLALT